MTAAIGFQAKLEANTGASQAYQTVSADVAIHLPAREFGKAEVTAHSQTDKVRRFIPTLQENGSMKCETYYTSTVMNALTALLGVTNQTSSVKTKFKATTPGGTGIGQTFEFEGWLQKIDEMELSRDGVEMLKFEILSNGPWTITDL